MIKSIPHKRKSRFTASMRYKPLYPRGSSQRPSLHILYFKKSLFPKAYKTPLRLPDVQAKQVKMSDFHRQQLL